MRRSHQPLINHHETKYSEDEVYHRMLSTDERVEFMVWCTVLFFEHLDCNKRLQNKREREEEGSEIGRHHIIIIISSLISHITSHASMPYQTTKTHQIEITYVAKRRVWLTTTAIHHERYQYHHYVDLLGCLSVVPRVLYFSPKPKPAGRAGFILSTGKGRDTTRILPLDYFQPLPISIEQ